MGVDRELRSGKKQKVGLTCLDVPPINSQPPDPAPLKEGPVHLKRSRYRMKDQVPKKNHEQGLYYQGISKGQGLIVQQPNGASTILKHELNQQTNQHGGRAVRKKDIEGLNDHKNTFGTCPGDDSQIVIQDVEDTTNQCLVLEHCELPSAGTDGGICKICGVDKNNDCILICDHCETNYHMDCLSPPVLEVPSGSWYCCPPCHAAGSKNTENAVYHCVVCERLSNMETI